MTSHNQITPARLPNPQMRKPDELRPTARNARTHSRKQVRQIADSIRAFGFTNPVLVDRDGQVIAGHGRLAAAQLLGLEQVPTLCIDWLSESEQRTYVIADNRLAEKAGWDRGLLALELGELCDLEIDASLTGFDTAEIELILDAGHHNMVEDIPPQLGGLPVCQVGDAWKLGRHRLLCGDALDGASYRLLMGRDKARLVVTDPPYNVPIGGHVSGLGGVRHREFVQGSGELSDLEFLQFLTSALAGMAKVSREGSLHYVFMDWRHLPELVAAGRAVYDDWLNLCVWAKSNAGMGSLYRSQHELVAVFRKGRRPHVNNVELGRHGRHRSNVWHYAGANSFSAGRDEALLWHPTVKPLEMIVDIIKDASDRDEIVLDGFGGSGTTLIAAEQCQRTARLLELDPLYCDVILRRFEAACGQMSILSSTGETFREVEHRLHREESNG
ncbi:MAG: DNA methyltransferase [Sphingomicrobium sp.]